MPNLAQLYATVNAKTAYSRPSEIYSALDRAGFRVYTAVLKEFGGFFLKFDTTTIILTPGTQEYPAPPDLGNLVCLSERQTSAENWHQINPTTVNNAIAQVQQSVGWSGYDDLYDDRDSMFQFYGPYLKADDITANPTSAGQVQKIMISPAIDAVRMCEIAYTAKWLPIVDQTSKLMLPAEGTYPMQDFAVAELHRANNDTLSREYEEQGEISLTAFLTWIRNRQTVEWPTVTSYLEG